jgi:hypothetical protein
MKELILKDDMGTDNYLKITGEDDGDIIVSVISKGTVMCSDPEVQFCASGTANPRVASFFRKLMKEISNT